MSIHSVSFWLLAHSAISKLIEGNFFFSFLVFLGIYNLKCVCACVCMLHVQCSSSWIETLIYCSWSAFLTNIRDRVRSKSVFCVFVYVCVSISSNWWTSILMFSWSIHPSIGEFVAFNLTKLSVISILAIYTHIAFSLYHSFVGYVCMKKKLLECLLWY